MHQFEILDQIRRRHSEAPRCHQRGEESRGAYLQVHVSLHSDALASLPWLRARSLEVRLHHHGSGPSSFEYEPVGPFASRSASRTGSRAAC